MRRSWYHVEVEADAVIPDIERFAQRSEMAVRVRPRGSTIAAAYWWRPSLMMDYGDETLCVVGGG